MKELFFKDINTIADLLKKREISVVDLTKGMLNRIDELEPVLNSYISVLHDEAIKQAETLEKELIDGKIRSPLHGIPIAIKDIFETKGSVTTSGSKVFAHSISNRDAVVVKRLKDAGAIIIGKNNLHEFAMGATTENPHYGPTRNPWNVDKIPGGSSGGTAVAVAAGMAFAGVGTDTGGSIRLPAALCGIVGLKPTFDLVSTEGCTPMSWTLDHIGPMTRSVADNRIMLDIMTNLPKSNEPEVNRTSLKGITIGVCEEYFFENLNEDMEQIVRQALQRLKELGAEVVSIELEGITEALEAQRLIAKSEAFTFHESTFTRNPEMYGEDSQFRLNSGREVSASQYIRALRYRSRFIQHVLDTMVESKCDVIFAPTNITPPFDIGSIAPEESINNIFRLGRTPIGNLLGMPVISIPCGFTAEKLPVGFQLIGKHFNENLLFSIGEIYEKSESWGSFLEKNDAYLASKIF